MAVPPPPAGQARRGRVGLIVALVAGALVVVLAGGAFVVIVVGRLLERNADRQWQEEAAAIEGIVDYRSDHPEPLTREHREGTITYQTTPPMGGDHNGIWQNCQGTVYYEPIANEHAVHSLEHGAVWVTYDPDLSPDQVARLEGRVRGTDYTFLSPYPEQETPISLQAWGYQLALEDARDPRIDEFIRVLRVNAGVEPGATCGGGTTGSDAAPAGSDSGGVLGRGRPDGAAAPSGECEWLPDSVEINPNLTEVGTPPPGEPRSGVSTMTITTNWE